MEEIRFPSEVIENLKTYVYRLIDPRNGETFYIGKGIGNRVFDHIKTEVGLEGDEIENKFRRIRDIRMGGFEVAHVIHRHGMDDTTAYQVEAALLDAYPGLTNQSDGRGNSEFGSAHAKEIISKYAAEEAIFQHKTILIAHRRSDLEKKSLYEAVRFAWKMDLNRAMEAEVVLAVFQGIIRGVFNPKKWMIATSANFPEREDRPDRIGFVGEEAPSEIQRLYVGKRVPDKYRKRGAANPVKYTY